MFKNIAFQFVKKKEYCLSIVLYLWDNYFVVFLPILKVSC